VEPDRTEIRPADQSPAPHSLAFRRLLDLPRGIVWDALVDPVLVSGWLGEADIEAVPGGRFEVRSGAPEARRPPGLGCGRIVALTAPAELEIESAPGAGGGRTRLRFVLDDLPGGPRDRSTGLSVTVSPPAPFARPDEVAAAWLSHLDLLPGLLHGHPVDWDRWAADCEPGWRAHRAAAGRRPGAR
jgi:uncharacterized protein YndB with AHSA1/START domain